MSDIRTCKCVMDSNCVSGLIRRVKNHEGRETSLLLSLCVVCFALALMIGEEMTSGTRFSVNPACALLLLILLQIVASVFMAYVIYKTGKGHAIVTFSARSRTETKLRKVKSFGGLWIFGAGGIILDAISFIYAIKSYPSDDRIDTNKSYGNACKFHLVTLMLFHLVKVVFFAVQIHFLQNFYYAKFHERRFTRYVIYLIVSVNGLVWMSCFQQEATSVSSHYATYETIYQDYMVTSSTNYTYSCLQGNSTWGDLLHSAGKYLYPCTMEYCFIAVGLLSHILDSFSDDQPPTNQNPDPDMPPNYGSLSVDVVTVANNYVHVSHIYGNSDDL